MKNRETFIIAEAGVNHNGSIDIALELARQAKLAGANAIKFQTFITEKIMVRYAPMAKYQQDNTLYDNQFDMVKRLELSYIEFKKIKEYCNSIGIIFLSTPDEEISLKFLLDELKVKVIKVGSGEITNIPFLKRIGETERKVILSTGMSTLDEVASAISTLEKSGTKEIALLHCTTDYPAKIESVNLKAMLTMKKTFKKEVGYSDHTIGDSVAVAAVAMGASIIEKHFTLDNLMDGPDHCASMNPCDFKQMVQKIRLVEKALGDGEKKPTSEEMNNRIVVRRSIVAACDIKKDEQFDYENICCKRPATGISPTEWEKVIGKRATRNFVKDELIEI